GQGAAPAARSQRRTDQGGAALRGRQADRRGLPARCPGTGAGFLCECDPMTIKHSVTVRSLRSLDWLNFFVANVQTGFGPFIASYLASHKWTQGEIGMVLSIGTISAMVSQVPGGAAVDALKNKKGAAAWAIVAIILSAVLLASSPTIVPVIAAEVFHGFASCMLV